MIDVRSPFNATVTAVKVAVGDQVAAGTVVAVLESMKIEHPVTVEDAGVVVEVAIAVGDTLAEGDAVVRVEPGEVSVTAN